MPDKTEPKDLETVLAKLQREWQELAALLTSQGKSQDRVIEVEKILLRDASGQYRGKISANPDGSADLLLSGPAGNAWARLGVNRDGEAFLELKDQKGESSFKVAVGAPSLEAGPGPAATPADGLAAAEGASLAESGSVAAPLTPHHDEPPGWEVNSRIFDRLEKLARQYRRLKLLGILILGVFGAILALQAYVFFRPHSPGLAFEALMVRDPNGRLRAALGAAGGKVGLDLWDPEGRRRAALGLGSEGAPHLAFYDRDQRVRAELNLGPDGEPKFTWRDKRGLETLKDPKPPDDSARQPPPGGTGLGSEAGALPSPPAGQAEAVSPNRDAEAEVGFVGFKNSNKYHYPACKWARTRYPANLIKFKSAADAQARHYIPCPVCKPPPLSR